MSPAIPRCLRAHRAVYIRNDHGEMAHRASRASERAIAVSVARREAAYAAPMRKGDGESRRCRVPTPAAADGSMNVEKRCAAPTSAHRNGHALITISRREI